MSIRKLIMYPVTIRRKLIAKRIALALAEKVRYCNICGWRGERFNIVYNEIVRQKEEIVCPNCLSEPRQRALFSYLRQRLLEVYLNRLKYENILCLEVGADRSKPVERAIPNLIYVTIDLLEGQGMYEMDLTGLSFPDNTFDLVVCSHVLEHIKDDYTAMSEIFRVTRNSGIALIQVPLGYYGDRAGITTVEFGERLFYEHYRSYGLDIKGRLEKAGFRVNELDYHDKEMGMDSWHEVIFECSKPSRKVRDE